MNNFNSIKNQKIKILDIIQFFFVIGYGVFTFFKVLTGESHVILFWLLSFAIVPVSMIIYKMIFYQSFYEYSMMELLQGSLILWVHPESVTEKIVDGIITVIFIISPV